MRKIVFVIVGLIILGGGYWAYYSLSNIEKKRRPQPEKLTQTVFVTEVKNTILPVQVVESGRIYAKNRVELYSEVQGVMESTGKEFKPGQHYAKGETLLHIRNNDYYANLQAKKSDLQNLITSILPDLRLDFPKAYEKWDAYLREFDMEQPVKPLPEPDSEKEKFFITGRNIYTSYYNTKNMEIVLQKYNLRAPFNGVLTEGMVNPGTLIRPGQRLGELIDPTVYEMEVLVSKSLLPALSIGKTVEVHDKEFTHNMWQGKIIRINGKVDAATQTVQVYIELRGNDLREGMYLEAWMQGKDLDNCFEVNRKLLLDQKEVYLVKDNKLELRAITPVHFTDNTALVRGLNDGEIILSRAVPGAYPGMEVSIYNPSAGDTSAK